GFFVEDWESSGETENLLIDLRIGFAAEAVGRAGEHFGCGGELDVNLHADEDFVGFDGSFGHVVSISRSRMLDELLVEVRVFPVEGDELPMRPPLDDSP